MGSGVWAFLLPPIPPTYHLCFLMILDLPRGAKKGLRGPTHKCPKAMQSTKDPTMSPGPLVSSPFRSCPLPVQASVSPTETMKGVNWTNRPPCQFQ